MALTAGSESYVRQLLDGDPGQTSEWLDSLTAVMESQGAARARFLVSMLLDRARELDVGERASVSTAYVNTIPVEEEAWFPGDAHLERRIRAHIRWNAAVMVVRANNAADGIGGHLSSFASSAALYEVGFNHFFRGKDGGRPGDHVYIQGHAAPGIYARAFLEGRLSVDDLDVDASPAAVELLGAESADGVRLRVPGGRLSDWPGRRGGRRDRSNSASQPEAMEAAKDVGSCNADAGSSPSTCSTPASVRIARTIRSPIIARVAPVEMMTTSASSTRIASSIPVSVTSD